jgi:thioredoxin-related protein
MKSKTLFILAGLLLVLSLLPLLRTAEKTDGGDISWFRDVPGAFENAKAEDRNVVLFLYTDWCGYCRQMDSTTFVDPAVTGELGERFTWLRLNAETDREGAERRERYGVTGFPTIMLLTADDEEIDRIPGYVPPDRFRSMVLEMVESPTSLAGLRERLASGGPDPEAQFALAAKYMERGMVEQAAENFRKAAELDPANQSGRADQSLYYYAETQVQMRNTAEALRALQDLQRRFPESELAGEADLMRAEIHFNRGETDQAKDLLSRFLVANPDHRAAAQIRRILDEF